MKYRSRRSHCKECSACLTVVAPSYKDGALGARSAVGLKSASTVVGVSARSAVGLQSASTLVSAISARSAAGLHSASTVADTARSASAPHCSTECGGSQICEHGRERRYCKECGGAQSASTVVGASWWRQVSTVARWGRNLRARPSALSVQGVRNRSLSTSRVA